MDVFYEQGFWEFFFIVIVIGGGSSYMAGRAVAQGWQSYGLLAFYCLLLAAATRFLLYALFQETLLGIGYLAVSFVVCFAFSLLGHRIERTRQMTTQYSWANKRTTPLTWSAR